MRPSSQAWTRAATGGAIAWPAHALTRPEMTIVGTQETPR